MERIPLSGYEFESYKRRNTTLQVVLGVLSGVLGVAVLVLAIVNVNISNEERGCPLTYDRVGSAVSEADMRRWAADAKWTQFAVPKWNDAKQGCSCEDDSGTEDGLGKTPVWIAPADLWALFPHTDFPPGFPKTLQRPEDHVKVCLEHTKLDQLWRGDDEAGHLRSKPHCHQDDPFFLIYTGWDGDLFCKICWNCNQDGTEVSPFRR